METVVIYNAGKAARLAGEPRIAPAEINYPVRSRYHADCTDWLEMTAPMRGYWLDGFDGRYDRRRSA